MLQKKNKMVMVISIVLITLITTISVVGFFLNLLNLPKITSNSAIPIVSSQGPYIVNTTADLEALSNQWDFPDHVEVNPTAPISGTLSNFTQVGFRDFLILPSVHSIDITLDQVNISRLVQIEGSATVKLTTCNLGGYVITSNSATVNMTNVQINESLLLSNNPTLTMMNVTIRGEKLGTSDPVIGSATLNINGLSTKMINLPASGGSFQLQNGNTTEGDLKLSGFNSVVLTDVTVNVTAKCNLTQNGNVVLNGLTVPDRTIIGVGTLQASISNSVLNELYVYSTSNTTIQSSTVPTLVELIKPIVVVEQSSFNIPYTFLFESSKDVTIRWTGYDNIQGANYGVTYNLTIIKDGVPVETISQATTTYILKMQTASSYTIQLICIDAQGNISTQELISIVANPSMLGFILMLVAITGGIIGTVLFLSWRKQRQWQKTSLLEIPTG